MWRCYLCGKVAGVRHGGAQEEGVVVDVDLEGVHVVLVEIVDLYVGKKYIG